MPDKSLALGPRAWLWIRILVFWSDPDQVLNIKSDPDLDQCALSDMDSDQSILSDPDPVLNIKSDPDANSIFNIKSDPYSNLDPSKLVGDGLFSEGRIRLRFFLANSDLDSGFS